MKKIVYLLLMFLLLTGCTSSKKYLETGNYSMAVNKAVSKLQKNPDKESEIAVLKDAYARTQQQNLDRIMYLRKTGQPDIWAEVFSNYEQMKYRQGRVSTLPPSVLNAIGFVAVDYDNEIIEAQKKACEYFYAHGKQQLAKNEKLAAREAYEDFMKVKQFYNEYRDVDDLINKAVYLGTTNVLFMMQNNSNSILPRDFEQEFLNISFNDMGSKWVMYDTYEQKDVKYDYTIVLNLRLIEVSPERLKERVWTESREIEDGWKYKLDNNGNVMKDTAGNDIKIPKFVKVTCDVLETHQNKEAILSGKVDFYNEHTNQLMLSEPVTASSVFDNYFIVARGELAALSPETQRRLVNGPVPFPNDLEMIMMANEYLQKNVKSIIRYKGKMIQ